MMRGLMARLMNGTAILRAPEGEAGGGSVDGNAQGRLGNDLFSVGSDKARQQQKPDDSGGDDDGDGDIADLLAEFGDDEDDSGDDDDKPEDFTGADTALKEELMTTLKGLRLPDDLIPDDFDASDKKQLTDVLTKAHRQGVGSAVGMVMKPMQVAMQRLASQMEKVVDKKLKGYSDSNEAKNHIDTITTDFGDPNLKPMIKMMDDRLKDKKIGAAERAQKIRKSLSAMRLGNGTGKSTNSGNGGGSSGSGMKSGAAALDLFVPMTPKK